MTLTELGADGVYYQGYSLYGTGVVVVEAREDGAVCQMEDVCRSALFSNCLFTKHLSVLRLLWGREARQAGFIHQQSVIAIEYSAIDTEYSVTDDSTEVVQGLGGACQFCVGRGRRSRLGSRV